MHPGAMKGIVLLFAALLVVGCGEKPSSEGSDSSSGNPTAPSESVKPSSDSPKPPGAVVMEQKSALPGPKEPVVVKVNRPFFHPIMGTRSRTGAVSSVA